MTNYGDNEEYEENDVDEDDQGEEDIFDDEDDGLREGLHEGGKLCERVGNEHLGNLLSSWISVAQQSAVLLVTVFPINTLDLVKGKLTC